MAVDILDEDLFTYKEKIKGQTVIVTGASSGFGKAAAIAFAQAGAKIVIGDVNQKGAETTLAEIKNLHGEAVFQTCDITNWDQQVSLFELALKTFGRIDIIFANAGISEAGRFADISVGADGLPLKPNMATIDVNLVGALYTINLSVHYLQKNSYRDSLKAIVVTGSLLSINNLALVTLYGGAKHGVLAAMKTTQRDLKAKGIKISLIAPWFADTGIIDEPTRALLSGIPLTPVSRVAGTIVFAATDEAPESHGAVYVLPDDKLCLRIPSHLLDLENSLQLFKLLDDRMLKETNT